MSGSKTFDIKPKSKFDAKLAAARRFTLHVVIVVQDAAGHRAQRSYTVTVLDAAPWLMLSRIADHNVQRHDHQWTSCASITP